MSAFAWILIGVFLLLVLACVKPLGLYMANVFAGRPIWPLRAGAPFERWSWRLCGIDPLREMDWKGYALGLLLFNTLGALTVYALQRLQVWLPLNPQHFAAVSPDSAFNTAVSFVTNTNWQGYSGESAMSYLTQMAGLAVQNFLSAATGIVVVDRAGARPARGTTRAPSATSGSTSRAPRCTCCCRWRCCWRSLLVSQGVIQNFRAYQDVTTLETLTWQQPKTDAAGNAAQGRRGQPRAGDAEHAHPDSADGSDRLPGERSRSSAPMAAASSTPTPPTPTRIRRALSNLLEMLAILAHPRGAHLHLRPHVGDTRQGWAVLAAMAILFVALLLVVEHSEQQGNPLVARLGVDQAASATQAGGNMEGKETRFGIAASALFASVTTATSCGAVNGMHDSYTPLGGFVPLFQMQLGEVVFGGVGTGLYSMLIFAIVGVFIAGLMIGRTPEYLGKKIESFEMKMSSIAILVMPFIVLTGTAIAVSVDAGRSAVGNPGAHGFSEILYAFSSAANNNGSAFGGISANTPFYNVALALTMWLGRFWPIVAVLAVAGSMAAKKRIPVSDGTMPTHGPTFVVLLIGTVLLVGALTFVPALALGPIIEHVILWSSP